jgi:hypothetical protein
MLSVTPQWGQLQVNGPNSPMTLQVSTPNGIILEVGMSEVNNIAVGLPGRVNLDIGVQGPPGAGSGGGSGNSYFPSGW